MASQIDFRTFDAFKATAQAALKDASLSEEQLESLSKVVARDDVTIHSINSSKLSDSEKGVAALMMLLRDNPNDAKLSRISSNLAEFFDRVVAGKERSFSESLRADALGTDPFASWGPLRIKGFDQGTFQLADTKTNAALQIRENGAGEIDVTQAQGWTPGALETALTEMAAATAPSDNPVMQRLRRKLDAIEAKVIQRAHAALTSVRDEKVGKLTETAGALELALDNPKKPEYEVPQANIDTVGHALAAAIDNPPPDETAQLFAVPLPQFKNDLVASVAELADRDYQKIHAALDRLSAIEGGQVTLEVARRVGLEPAALRQLTVFRAIEASLEVPGVHETIRNIGSLKDAADALLKGPSLDAALQKLQAELNDPDPLGLFRGRSLLSNNPQGINRQTPISAVNAVEAEGSVTGYVIATNVGHWTLDEQGITSSEKRDAPHSIVEYSIDALRTLTSALLAASPESVKGPLSYFRKSEERANGGFSYARLLENLSAALAEKMTHRMEAIDDVVKALAPLGRHVVHGTKK